MKKLIVLMLPMALFLFNPQGLFAQQEEKKEQKEELTARGAEEVGQAINLEELRTALQLSDEQFTKLQGISETYQAKRMNLKTKVFESAEAKQEAHKELMKAQMAEMNNVLTEEQQTKMMEMLQEKHGMKKGYQKEGGDGSR